MSLSKVLVWALQMGIGLADWGSNILGECVPTSYYLPELKCKKPINGFRSAIAPIQARKTQE
ncbi:MULTISPECIES: hypothetical protein [Nostoc]|uniref:Uncharacterized protein n=2 Tax=Nostoc TaxID=1177 RepID=A0ABR8IGJ8_9NOSO|nr:MULTISPECIES: hypothetical protein [Nostoc]MBD2565123.1 hypothetical protein [Nostoc linckia FACHB-391]MBD2650724.1 hypothetical protein [Nostoc foliaceum FACHB-393]